MSRYRAKVWRRFAAGMLLLVGGVVLLAVRSSSSATAVPTPQQTPADCNHNGIPDASEVPPLSFIGPALYHVGKNPVAIASADIDGDGRQDIVLADGDASAIWVLRNRGDGTFAPGISYPSAYPSAIAVADLDGDGADDVIAVSRNSNRVGIMLNQGGVLGAPVSYATALYPTLAVPADVDGDGDVDLLIESSALNLDVLLNQGDGTFLPGMPVPIGPHNFLTFAAGDFNGDGKIDIALPVPVGLSILSGQGGGTFENPHRVISTPFNIGFVAAADLDGDGDLDLVTDGDSIGVYLNDGTGVFGSRISLGAVNYGSAILLADYDGDGDIDIAAVPNQDSLPSIEFARNGGNGSFSPAETIHFPNVRTPLPYTHAIVPIDVDEDGKIGLAAVLSPGTVAVLRSGRADVFDTALDLDLPVNSQAIAAADLTGDGRPDIAVAVGWGESGGSYPSDGSVVVFPALASGGFGPEVSYAVGKAPISLVAADLNGDGHIDLVTADEGSKAISILINDGTGTFAAARSISVGQTPNQIIADDLDGDGAVDLAVAGAGGVTLFWNDGAGNFTPDPSVGLRDAIALASADFDEDGRPDLIVSLFSGLFSSKVYYLRNQGGRSFAPSVQLLDSLTVSTLATGDIDGDGHLDLVAGLHEDMLRVLRGKGDGTFAPPSTIDLAASPRTISLADIDGDGDLDAVVHAENGEIVLMRNSGAGILTAVGGLASENSNASTAWPTMVLRDLDGDGRPDIVVAANYNTAPLASVFFNRSLKPTAEDCNDDRIPDECQLAGADCSGNGVPDFCEPDTDGDGVPDSCDLCPGQDDRIDGDGDGVPDCADNCPEVPNPGQEDRDGDGVGDACDGCPDSALKTAPGECGCDTADQDSDHDGTPDCVDGCPNDYFKVAPGICGCGIMDVDLNHNGVIDCLEAATATPTPSPTAPATPTAAPPPPATPIPFGKLFQVNSTTDAVDVHPGDGICADAAGECTLRAAVQEANADAGRDMIAVPAGTYVLSLPGIRENAAASGDLDITDHVTLRGEGADLTVIDGDHLDRVFEVKAGVEARIEGVTIQNGQHTDAALPVTRKVEAVGGILNFGSLTLVSVTMKQNTVPQSVGALFGVGTGALSNLGDAVLVDCVLDSNSGPDSGGITNGGFLRLLRTTSTGDTGSDAGALWNLGQAEIDQSVFEGGYATNPFHGAIIFNGAGSLKLRDSGVRDIAQGIGLSVLSGTVDVERSVVSGNAFGGIENEGTLSVVATAIRQNGAQFALYSGLTNTGTASVIDSAVTGNSTNQSGGGINNSGSLQLIDTTVSGNSSTTGVGGGITNGGSLDLRNVTIVGNTSGAISGSGEGGGLFEYVGGTAVLSNTIIAGNVASGGLGPDCSGVLDSHGYNLIGDLDACLVTGDTTGNLTGVEPGLGDLADNGGPTLTQALLPGSPAIDAGNPAAPGSSDDACPSTDQRGALRPQGASCDIGAYEANPNCGNGQLDSGETCDDGNTTNGDCCSSVCTLEGPGPLAGDANCDGRIDAGDITAMLRLLATGERSACGRDDADGDCLLTPADVDTLKQMLLYPQGIPSLTP